eukprot:COSAG02_NODE_48641_length_332_cov_0.866953_2_plen_37_part_01
MRTAARACVATLEHNTKTHTDTDPDISVISTPMDKAG